MYHHHHQQQQQQSSASADSVRKSNNPFRQPQPQPPLAQNGHTHSYSPRKPSNLSTSSSQFDKWVLKNKQLLETSDDEYADAESHTSPNRFLSHYHSNTSIESIKDDRRRFLPTPAHYKAKPVPIRADSDSSVDYKRQMKSNNPFASALNEETRSPVRVRERERATPPARPPKPEEFAPPSYEEAAGPEAAKKEYRREKQSSTSTPASSKEHRSHSDPAGRGSKHRSSSSRHKHSSRNKSPSKKKEAVPAKNLDTIDKLDVTGFFGGGFHHDGPFDACTPHRNKNAKKAPVMAFPVDGPNNSIAGAGNVDKDAQMKLAFGNYEEPEVEPPAVIKTNRVSNDTSTSIYTPKQNPSVINFDSTAKAEPIHGFSTAGLGSTTFLDGAPAPKAADDNLNLNNGGLSRKKSLVQRLTKSSGSDSNSRRSSNDGLYSAVSDNENSRRGSLNGVETNSSLDDDLKPPGNSFIRRVKSLKVRK
ncbi:uncharacterized protein LODBEIA_P32760 [Lodderomyces beijingensis]|uniref:Pal1-domain-containing protein n=1 Tax=Lodderomyces beijingensis TaxID=1775926 RepID=A0ABP0ZNY7_9ASCO